MAPTDPDAQQQGMPPHPSAGDDEAQTETGRFPHATAALGAKLEDYGHRMRSRTDPESRTGRGVARVAAGFEGAGEYFRTHDVSDITEDAASWLRRNPVPATVAGMGAGILFALRRSDRAKK